MFFKRYILIASSTKSKRIYLITQIHFLHFQKLFCIWNALFTFLYCHGCPSKWLAKSVHNITVSTWILCSEKTMIVQIVWLQSFKEFGLHIWGQPYTGFEIYCKNNNGWTNNYLVANTPWFFVIKSIRKNVIVLKFVWIVFFIGEMVCLCKSYYRCAFYMIYEIFAERQRYMFKILGICLNNN